MSIKSLLTTVFLFAIIVAYATVASATIADKYKTMKSLMRHINIIARCAGMYRADRLGDSELGAVHQSYVLAICKHPGISQDELARHICINKSNVTRKITYLEEHGYVTRVQSDSDKRITLVYPTKKMQNVLPQVRAATDECNEYMTQGFTKEELLQFGKLLERVSERAKSYMETRGNDKP